MSLTCGHIWAHVGNMWVTRHPRVFAGPHMCLTCEKSSSHASKLEKHNIMWNTCEPMWATCAPHVDSK